MASDVYTLSTRLGPLKGRTWDWMPGMVTTLDKHNRAFRLTPWGTWHQEMGPTLRCDALIDTVYPDLSDHATRWSLVGQIVEKHGGAGMFDHGTNNTIWFMSVRGLQDHCGDTMAEAIVNVLEDT